MIGIFMGVATNKLTFLRQNGQGMVEFAISLVFLMIIVAAIVDGGRALFTYMALRDAAQEGALYGSIEPEDTYGITTRVHESSNMAEDLVGVLQIGITYTDTSNNPKIADGNPATADICFGDGIIVAVEQPTHTLTMPFLGTILGTQSLSISASIADTVLNPSCP